jgi:putative transposase
MSQSLSSILVHIIFSTKNRQRLILANISQDLYSYMAEIARSHETLVHEIGGVEDHVHLLISLPRTLALSKLVEET